MRLLLRRSLLRRLLTIPGLVLFTAVAVVLAPLVLIIDGALMLRPNGRGRAARITIWILVYLYMEITGLINAGWLWLRTRKPFGAAYEHAHFALLARLLGRLYQVGAPLFALRIEPPDGLAAALGAESPLTPGRPLVVLSRHAGPGDSFLIVHALLNVMRRNPRIVLKQTLTFDPVIDVLISRLPHCFVGPGETDVGSTIAGIKELAGTLGPTDALLIFPEGGNFTRSRRQRALASLRRRGLTRRLGRARQLKNVLPPQPAGVFAAIDAAPHADLAFVAHTGLDHMQSVRQVWDALPLTRPVEVTWWTVPSEQVPRADEARLRWLHDNWSRIDEWIGSSRADDDGESPSTGPVVTPLDPA